MNKRKRISRMNYNSTNYMGLKGCKVKITL